MKRIFKFFMYTAMAVAVVASCTKDPVTEGSGNNEGGNNEGGNNEGGTTDKTKPELVDEMLEASAVGDTLEVQFTAAGAWTIAAEDCDWVTADPTSGAAGEMTVTLYVQPNQSDRTRTVDFIVSQEETETLTAGDIYAVTISQVKMELPLLEGDYEFLKWMVDNKVYGDATPVVTDWYAFDPGTYTFPFINFDVDAAGKVYIKDIYYYSGDADGSNQLFNAFPPTINLSKCESIYINCTADGTAPSTMAEWLDCPLKASEFPQEWNCPELWRVHLECVGMQGTIPASFAALPKLEQFFIRCCDIYGAIPYDWKSPVLGNLVIALWGSHKNYQCDCPNLGYVIPKSFDIILNSEKSQVAAERQRDKGGVHVGGPAENWIGFEEGWGQKRYEKFDPNAEAGNVAVWSAFRGLTEGSADEIAPGGLRNPNELGADSPWYVDSWSASFGYYKQVPETMVKWDDTAAEAYTTAAAAKARVFTR